MERYASRHGSSLGAGGGASVVAPSVPAAPARPAVSIARRTVRSACFRAFTLALLLVPLDAAAARASDEAAFKDLKSRYEKLARNQDDDANRERRHLLLQSFDYLDQKACRTFLRKAYGEENTSDNRIAAVQILAASGDPKDLEFLLNAFKKEKAAGPPIALGEGIGYTPETSAGAVSAWIGAQLSKQKGEPLRSLLEGLGALGDASGYAPLLALGDKIARAEQFERLVALGACGKAASVAVLAKYAASMDDEVRLAAATGLASTGDAASAPHLEALLRDRNPRVVEQAAKGLADLRHAASVPALAEAFAGAPLRTKEAVRAALRALTEKDFGHDGEAWKAGAAAKPLPVLPKFFGIEVASDRVVGLLDLSRSMDWKGRLDRAREGMTAFVQSLPDDTSFDLVGVGRTPVPFAERMTAGPGPKQQAAEWIGKQLTGGGGFDLREALLHVLRSRPDADTLVLATDSYPWGDARDDTPLEVLQEFRRENRGRRIRVHVAFVAPGGRYVESEPVPEEYQDRKGLMQLLAESTGGSFVAIE